MIQENNRNLNNGKAMVPALAKQGTHLGPMPDPEIKNPVWALTDRFHRAEFLYGLLRQKADEASDLVLIETGKRRSFLKAVRHPGPVLYLLYYPVVCLVDRSHLGGQYWHRFEGEERAKNVDIRLKALYDPPGALTGSRR